MKLYELSKQKKFVTWLNKMGAEVLDPTNPYEVIRFRTQNGVSVIYTGKKGITFTGEAREAYIAFDAGKKWKAIDRKRKNLRAKKARLAARDGKRCFIHGEKMNFDDLTIEHLLSFSHGGTDNENNLCLACGPCQKELGTNAKIYKVDCRKALDLAEARNSFFRGSVAIVPLELVSEVVE